MTDTDSHPYEASDPTKHEIGSDPIVYQRPKGFKGFYYHPYTQVSFLGFVCFMCPGLFNALNGTHRWCFQR